MGPLIAIIDDDQAVREALQRMLEAYGFAAAVFASAEDFLSSAQRHLACCLIIDIRMPGTTGMALHRRLIADGCRVPTILITACPTSGEREEAIAAGALAYLAKPFSEQALLGTVREALKGSRHGAD
jgi:FixJ family two-component response regulator